MAFVYRRGRDVPAEGFLDQYDIGPGSYEKKSMWGRQRPACVAFHSSSPQRVFPNSSVTTSPGPGSFDIVFSKGNGVGAPFKSKTSRFCKKQFSLGPGPGQYDVSETKKKVLRRNRAKSTGQRKHYRTIMPAIPSIPSSSQKYGYEETKNGELVPLTESLGKKNDSPRRRRRPRKSSVRAVSFGLSKTKRFANPHGTQYPGPGSYSTSLVTKPKLLHGKASAIFESRTKRTDLIRSKDITPAVGTYNITKQIGCTRKPSKHQFFGTTQERFGGDDARRVYSQISAGNSYPRRSDFDFRRSNVTQAAFGSTASQRQQLVSSKVSPGYVALKGFAEEKHFKNRFTSPFGTSASRFTQREDEEEQQQSSCVGTYEIEERWDSAKGATSSFESLTKRHALDEDEHRIKTEPAKYRIEQKWILDDAKERKNTLLKGSKRFHVPKHVAETPGPASYDTTCGVNAKHVAEESTERDCVMISKEKRFLKPKSSADQTPGVGTYNPEMLYGNLNRSTYNITIAREMYT